MARVTKPMLTTAEVAELLGGGSTDAWVRERCAADGIPAFKIGRHWRIDQDELAMWRKRQRFEAQTLPSFEPARARSTRRGSVSDILERRAARDQAGSS